MATRNNRALVSEELVLPSSCYTSQEFYQQEMEGIFSKTWVLVGRKDQVAKPGDFFTCTVAEEPILVVRSRDGELRAFYNVCRHRGTQVMVGEGNRKAFSCPYHGWTYSTEGELIGNPSYNAPPSFKKEEHGLRSVQVDSWGCSVFVNLDSSAAPLLSYLGDLPERVKAWRLEELKWTKRLSYNMACNWKLFADNFIEAYHFPIVHPTNLNTILDFRSCAVKEADGPYVCLELSAVDPASASGVSYVNEGGNRPFIAGLPEGVKNYTYVLFPNLLMVLSPDHVAIHATTPTDPVNTEMYVDFFFPEADREGFDASDLYEVYDRVNLEDIRLCERQQLGIRSRSYVTSPLDPIQEQGVREFRSFVRDSLASESP